MSYIFKKGATSQSIEVYIIDSTDGTPETGVLWNTAGIDLKYRRKDAAVVSITEAALTSPALTDTWESGGFLEIGNGVYRLDLPDAALASASGIDRVVVFGTVTGMVVLPVTIHLTDIDLNTALSASTIGTCTNNTDMVGTDGAALAAVVGALADAAADGAVTETDTLMQYLKQLINILIGAPGVVAFPAEAAPANGVSLAEVIRAIHADVTGLNGSAMVGTNSAALASVVGALADSAAEEQVTEADTLMQYIKQLINILIGTPGVKVFPSEAAPANTVSLAEVIRAIHADVTGLNGSAMVGTNSAALASVVGALADAAADGAVTEADTLMQYLKQLINILIGAPGIVAFPAEAAPGNGVSLSEVVRAIHADVTGLNGSAMVGTNNANTTVPDAAGTAPTAAEIKTAIEAAGSHLTLIKAITDWQRSVSGTVVVNNPGTDTIFDLTAVTGTLSTDDDSCNGMQITFYDNSGSIYETRKVNDFDGTNGRVTVDAALTFPVDDGVDTFILWNKYSPTAAAGTGATAQEVHEYDVSGITTEGQAGYEIQQRGRNSIYNS